jgi:hypothetical protein
MGPVRSLQCRVYCNKLAGAGVGFDGFEEVDVQLLAQYFIACQIFILKARKLKRKNGRSNLFRI